MATRSKPKMSALAALKLRMQNEGIDEEDTLLRSMRERLALEQEQAERARVADSFKGVTSTVSSTEELVTPRESRSGLSGLVQDNMDVAGGFVDAVQGSLQRAGSGALRVINEKGDALGPLMQAVLQSTASNLGTIAGQPARGSLEESSSAVADTLRQAAEANAKEVDKVRQMAAARGGLTNQVVETALDVGESGSSFLSIVGGPLAAIGLADAYGQSYDKARADGLDEEAAAEFAAVNTAPELISFIPAAKLVERLPGFSQLSKVAKSKIATTVQRALAKGTVTGGGEAFGEATTQAGQILGNGLLAEFSDNEEVRKYAASQLPATSGEAAVQIYRAAKAGHVTGFVGGSVEGGFSATADAGRRTSEFTANMNNAISEAKTLDMIEQNRARMEALVKQAESAIQAQSGRQGELFGANDGIAFESDEQRASRLEASALERQARARNYANAEAELQTADTEAREQAFRDMELRQIAEANPGNAMAQALAQANIGRLDAIPQTTQGTTSIPASTGTTQGELFANLETRTPQEIAVDEEAAKIRTQIDKQDKKALDAEKSKRAAERRTYMSDLLKENAGLPADERAKAVAQKMVEWDSANPVPTAATPVATPAKAATPAPVIDAPAAVELDSIETEALTDERTQEQIAADELSAYREFFPDATEEQLRAIKTENEASLSSVGNTAPTNQATLADVRDVVSAGVGSNRLNNSVAELVNTGRLKFITRDADIPANSDPNGTGWYDGNSVVVDVRKLDKNNLKGELLRVMSHEFKHAADVSGAAKAGALTPFIGKSANQALIRSIRAAARDGDVFAQNALRRAGTNATDGTLDLEIPAYYAEESQNKPTSITNRIVSAVRTGAKSAFGINDVNLNDVAYLSRKVYEDIANSDVSIAGDIQAPVAMVNSTTARGFEKAKEEGRTYTSVDGREKFVTSDAEMRVRPAAYDRLLAGEEMNLGDVIQHDVLFDNYPQAADGIEVRATDSLPPETYGQYDPTTKTLDVATTAVKGGDATLREAIIHELQHGVQDIEGYSDQFFNTNTPEMRGARAGYNEANKAHDVASRNVLDQFFAIKKAIPEMGDSLDQLVYDFNTPEYSRASQLAAEAKRYGIDRLPAKVREVVTKYDEITAAQNAAADSFSKISREQFSGYKRNITEREAFYTQYNVDTPQRLLPRNPEADMRSQEADPETGIDATGGAIDVIQGDGKAKAFGTLASVKEAPTTSPVNREEIAAAMNEELAAHNSEFRNAIVGVLDYTGGLGRKVDDKLQDSIGEAAWYAENARHNMANLEAGIKENAKRTGRSEQAIKTEITARMGALGKITSQTGRENALAAYVARNPELRPLIRAYADIAGASNIIADQLLAGKDTPTKADRELAQKIRDSAFAYTTNIYSTHQGREGKAIAKDIISTTARARKKLRENKPLTEHERTTVGAYFEGLNDVKNTLTVPQDKAALFKMTDSKLDALWDTWGKESASDLRAMAMEQAAELGIDVKEQKRAARVVMVNRLAKIAPTINSADIEAKAAAAIEEMLGLRTAGPIVSRTRSLSQDRGILQKREELSPAIARLLGKIEDPATLLGATLAKQGELIARTKFLMHLRDSGMLVSKDKANLPGYTSFTERVTGDSAGPLKDFYTTPRVAAALRGQLDTYTNYMDDMARAWIDRDALINSGVRTGLNVVKGGASLAKGMSIVFDALNMGLNAGGSPALLVMNGVYNLKHVRDALKAGVSSVADQLFDGKGGLNADLSDGIRYQVVDSARVQELRRTASKHIKSKIRNIPGADQPGKRAAMSAWYAAKDKAGTLKATTAEIFAMTDAWTKIAAFKDRVDTLEAFYKADGIEKDMDAIKSEAAADIRQTNITYGKVPPVLKAVESIGLTTFMGYFYNVPRVIVQNNIQGWKDIKRGLNATSGGGRNAMLSAGVRRIGGTATATAGMVMATKAIAQLMNAASDEDEEKIAEMKKGLRDDARFADPIYLGKDDNGVPLFFRLGRVDALGPVNDAFRVAFDDSISAEEKSKIIEDQLKGMVFSSRFLGEAVKAYTGEGSNNPGRAERILGRVVGEEGRYNLERAIGLGSYSTGRGVVRVADTLLPGQVDMADPNNKTATDPASTAGAILSSLIWTTGGKADRADPAPVVRGLSFEIGEIKKSARNELGEAVLSGASDERIASIIRDASDKMYEKMSRMTDLYEAQVAMTGSVRSGMDMLKEDGKLNSVQIHNVRRGLPPNDEAKDLVIELGGLLSKKSVKERYERRQESTQSEVNAEDKERFQQLYKRLRESYGIKAGE